MKLKLNTLAGIALILCFSIKGFAQTKGTLTFSLTMPKHSTGNYVSDGRYVVAIWLETNPQSGTSTFVKTILYNWGGISSNTGDHLPNWVSKSGINTIDAISGATSTVFTSRSISWNGTGVNGLIVNDGNYRIAVQETWGHNSATALRYFNFSKGLVADKQTPLSDNNFTAISLDWVPDPLGIADNVSPNTQVVIYPNPTQGIFNIEFKNEIMSIKIANVLGQVVYNEKETVTAAGTTKSINLSSFENGTYIVNVSNDEGTSSYKLILDK